MKKLALSLVAVSLYAQTAAPKPAAPQKDAAPTITSEMALGITKAQRDFLLADNRMRRAADEYKAAEADAKAAEKALNDGIADANKACGDKFQIDPRTVACVAKQEAAKQEAAKQEAAKK